MGMAEGYDVLRLIEHGRSCHVSSEYVKGTPLIRWLKYHPNLSKEQIIVWVQDMAQTLECIHRCRGGPCYKYLNPYTVIITEDRKLYFLDMNTESNHKTLLRVQRRDVRENFLPPGEDYYQTESISLDLYSLGKTIQYLLAFTEPEPPFTRREEIRFQRIISRCIQKKSKRAYAGMSELRKQIPVIDVKGRDKKENRSNGNRKTKWKVIRAVPAGFLLCAALFGIVQALVSAGDRGKLQPDREVTQEQRDGETGQVSDRESDKVKLQNKDSAKEDRLRMELGFLYFLEKKDYGKSREYFSEVSGNKAAEGLVRLSEYMKQGSMGTSSKLPEQFLRQIEENLPEEGRDNYYRCLIRGYGMLDTEEAAKKILQFGEYLDMEDEEIKTETIPYLAFAYEKTGDTGSAVETYKQMLEGEMDNKEREEIYVKMETLLEASERTDEAAKICREGIEEIPGSKELRLTHIRLLCGDSRVEREICAETIKAYLKDMPELKEEEGFKKLVQEYGITVKGDKVWLGKEKTS